MSLPYHDELLAIVNSTKIISKGAFKWQDRLFSDHKLEEKELSSYNNTQYDKINLGEFLYLIYHCRKTLSIFTKQPKISHTTDVLDFTNLLSGNNSGTGTWERGWKVIARDSEGNLIVKRNGLMLWVYPSQFLSDEKDPPVDTVGMIRIGKEYRYLFQGFYMALGNAYSKIDVKTVHNTLRFYWNINHNYASALTQLITSEFNSRLIPFKFKILNDPTKYPRADGAVLYIPKTHYPMSKTAILQVYRNIGKYLNPEVPLFAKILAPGLSLAEDPDNGESFGKHRSRILGEALYNAYFKNISSVEAVLAELIDYFIQHKIRLWQPYLNSESVDNYEIVSYA